MGAAHLCPVVLWGCREVCAARHRSALCAATRVRVNTKVNDGTCKHVPLPIPGAGLHDAHRAGNEISPETRSRGKRDLAGNEISPETRSRSQVPAPGTAKPGARKGRAGGGGTERRASRLIRPRSHPYRLDSPRPCARLEAPRHLRLRSNRQKPQFFCQLQRKEGGPLLRFLLGRKGVDAGAGLPSAAAGE
jgi:hypothetical protein